MRQISQHRWNGSWLESTTTCIASWTKSTTTTGPDTARRQLEAALRQELLRASAVGLVSAIAGGQPAGGGDPD